MDRQDLENDPKMEELFILLDLKPNTIWNYNTAMVKYTEFTGKSPTVLIEEAKQDKAVHPNMEEREIFLLLPRFRKHLQGSLNPFTGDTLSPGTIDKYMSCVRNFYQAFYIELPRQPKGKKKNVKPQKHNKAKTNKDEIRKAFEYANLRDRAIALCSIYSGMGASEISSLTLQAFRDGYDPDTGVTYFDMRRVKEDVDFETFIGPEATYAVLEYLEWRDRPPKSDDPKDVTEYEKRKTTFNSYLFISEKVHDKVKVKVNGRLVFKDGKPALTPGYLTTRNEEMRKLTPRAIANVYWRISDAAKIKTPRGHFNTFRSHNMRKLFSTTLKNKGADSDIVEYFMGHTLEGSKEAYFEGNPDDLKVIYMKLYPYLAIEKSFDAASSPEYQKALSEKDEAVLEAEKAKVERYEYVKLEKKNAALEERLRKLETQKQYNTAMNLLRGEESTYEDENGEMVTYTINDENNAAMRILKKYIDLMDTDENFDPSKVTEEELEKLMED